MRPRLWCVLAPVVGSLLLGVWGARAATTRGGKTPVILDTDIGGDIDDAFALAMLLQSRVVDLKAVTTVSADTTARARIAAKMLWVAGERSVPVAAGQPSPANPFPQADWAKDFTSPMLKTQPAVDLLHRTVQKSRGKVVLIALGPLTNVAALLKQYPQDGRAIRQIVLMGGSIARGYYPNSGPTAESNIASDAAAAQAVFAAGIPLLVAPLDVTAALQMGAPERAALFARHTPLTEALRQLYRLWGQPTPTLHDPMAVALLLHPGVSRTEPLHVEITGAGRTQVSPGRPNAVVALQADPAGFIQYYESLFARP